MEKPVEKVQILCRNCSFSVENVPHDLANSNICLLSLNADDIDFHKEVIPIIVKELNRIHSTIFEIYDASIGRHRRDIIRVNRLMHDTIEFQKMTRTSIRSGSFPCPVCLVPKKDLLANVVDGADRERRWLMRTMSSYHVKQNEVLNNTRINSKEMEKLMDSIWSDL